MAKDLNKDLNTMEARRGCAPGSVLAAVADAWEGARRAVKNNKIFCVVFVVVIVARYCLAPSGPMVTYIDTFGYYERACAPWWRLLTGFSSGGHPFARSFVYPLLMKLCCFNPESLAATEGLLHQTQILIGLVALAGIALAGCRVMTRLTPRLLWLGLFLAFSLSAFIHPWEPAALTEGVSNNVMVMLLGMTLLLASPAWGMVEALATLCLTTSFMFLRDANLFTGPTILGVVVLDQLLVRNSPRRAWGELRSRLAESPRNLLWSPLFILICGLAVVTGLKLAEMSQHALTQEINLRNFVAYRILDVPPLRKNFIKTFEPPQYVSNFNRLPKESQDLGALHNWVMQYYRPRHLRFLISNPATDCEMFTVFAQDFMARTACSIPSLKLFPYSYLYGTGKTQWDPKHHEWRIVLGYWIHRGLTWPFYKTVLDHVYWPYYLPPILLLTALFLRLRIGRATLFLPLCFLLATFYIHYFLSIFFDGTEDYRHALSGSFAMVMVPWLFAFALLQWAGTMMRRIFLKPRPATSEPPHVKGQRAGGSRRP